MNYSFPIIRHLDDVERHRADGLIHDAFKRGVRRNGTIVYDYAYMDNHVFPPIEASAFASVARELRGLTFDASSGALLSRPFQKFFNAGEREEVLIDKLPLRDPHHVLEKLDGSMIHAFVQPDGELVFGTRWGVTTVARQAWGWYASHDPDGAWRAAIRSYWDEGWTPIFEWTSPDNIIVVRHTVESLTLTGLRHRETGAYADRDALATAALAMNVPLVAAFDPITEWERFAHRALAETDGEGYVVRFADGHMVKVKNVLYARVHKFKSNLSQAKDAAEIVMSGMLDDMLPHLPGAERIAIETYRDDFMGRLRSCAARVDAAVDRARAEIATDDPRERQKLFWTTYAAPLNAPLSSAAADVWIGRSSAFEALTAVVLKNVGTTTRFDNLVSALGLPKFQFGFDGDQ